MIIVDHALRERAARQRPIRVGMVGCGFMGTAIARQLLCYSPGIELCAIANRTVPAALAAFTDAGADVPEVVENPGRLDAAIENGRPAVTDQPLLLTGASRLDVILEVTGTIEYAAGVVLDALRHRKHVVLMNAELDGTIGPILKHEASRRGVVIGNCDGDQPGVQMNLYRFVTGIGLTPRLCGNIKGLHDPYRTPFTQADFARRWGQRPSMVTSFADGTKIAFEQAIVANATGMGVACRGMRGFTVEDGTPIQQTASLFEADALAAAPGIVDYVVGAAPAPGVFVLATCEDTRQRHFLDLYKLGKGPLYCFHTPYHLCHFEAPNSIARSALFGDAAVTPLNAPRVEVVATAKRELSRGDVLDGIGEFDTYGQCEDVMTTRAARLLPMGLAKGCRLRRGIPRDRVLCFDDIELPASGIHLRWRHRQDVHFFGSSPIPDRWGSG
jgi:predicted homoserine dehydrogenase-like protein